MIVVKLTATQTAIPTVVAAATEAVVPMEEDMAVEVAMEAVAGTRCHS